MQQYERANEYLNFGISDECYVEKLGIFACEISGTLEVLPASYSINYLPDHMFAAYKSGQEMSSRSHIWKEEEAAANTIPITNLHLQMPRWSWQMKHFKCK